MPIGTTAVAITAIFGASVYSMRRKISSKWINLRYKNYGLNGKTFLITGGNVGLGYETAKEIARRGGNVVLACRNTTKGDEAVASIVKAAGGNTNVFCMKLDLASLSSVNAFIKEAQSKYESIDVLICNAGVWIPMEQKMKTQDGYEMHFGVNHLAHLAIAKGLIPQLERSNDGRIIFVSSGLMERGKIDLKNAVYTGREENSENGQSSFAPPTGYCDSKLMNAMTSKYLATVLPPSIVTYSVCPGFCRSSLARNVSIPWYQKTLVGPLMLMIQRTQLQGAQNIIFAACESKDSLESGTMYRDGKAMTSEMTYMDSIGGISEAKKLWDFSVDLLEKH